MINDFRRASLALTEDWMAYTYRAWVSAGSPPTLDPEMIFASPIDHNANTYRWIEERYQAVFREVFESIHPTSGLIASFGMLFSRYWNQYFDPLTLWKQIRPLFAFGAAFGEINSSHIQLAIAYAIGQGIPSMVVDAILDSSDETALSSESVELLPFCLMAYSAAIEMISKLKLSPDVARVFSHYTCEMYQRMWHEKQARYVMPGNLDEGVLQQYVQGNSRILSSVFFGISIEWAFSLASQESTQESITAWEALRRVRQLNDEIVDLSDDIGRGLLTCPSLHGLTLGHHHRDLHELILKLWSVPAQQNLDRLLLDRIHLLLLDSGSYEYTARASLEHLLRSMEYVMSKFSSKDAFEITLVLNQRLTMLIRLSDNRWTDVKSVYYPDVRQLLASSSQQ